MVMPADPGTYLIMTQPHLAFAHGKKLLHSMAPAMHFHKLRQRGFRRGVRQRVPALGLPINRADDDHTLATTDVAILVLDLHPPFQSANHLRPFGAGAQMHLAPTPWWLGLSPFVNAAPRRSPMACRHGLAQVTDLRVAGHIQHILPASSTQLRPEGAAASEFVIACNPAKRQHRAAAV